MSNRKRPLAELRQPPTTPSQRTPVKNHAIGSILQRTGARARSSRSAKRIGSANVDPASARGILRRLAKVTAATTHKRAVTPISTTHGKENEDPHWDADQEHDEEIPKSRFAIDGSFGEDDSELPVAPTPSALLEDTDDDPTLDITFEVAGASSSASREATQKTRISVLPQSDPAFYDERDDDYGADDGASTFLTERGRRAISEEPTRMSRYSFGSIRMSEFGSELEIRRESDRQLKLAALDKDDDYGTGITYDDIAHGGAETEHLRHLRQLSPRDVFPASGSPEPPERDNDTFQLVLPEEEEGDEAMEVIRANELGQAQVAPANAESFFLEDVDPALDEGFEDNCAADVDEAPGAPSRRQMLLESVAAAAKPRSKKRQKRNQYGNMVPSLPSSLIKKVVHEGQERAGKRKTTLGKEHMQALEQATEWFFEQVSEDLQAYASHGRRKKRIDADDVMLLMKRQRQLQHSEDLAKLAKQWLPREIRAQLDLSEDA